MLMRRETPKNKRPHDYEDAKNDTDVFSHILNPTRFLLTLTLYKRNEIALIATVLSTPLLKVLSVLFVFVLFFEFSLL